MTAPDARPYLAMLLYIPISLGLALSTSQPKAVRTIFYIFMGGVMFLPELVAFDAPLVPPLSKYEFSGLMGLAAAAILHRRRLLEAKPLRGVDLFFVVILVGNVGTVLTNSDTLMVGEYRYTPNGVLFAEPKTLSGHRPLDILAVGIRDTLSTYVPFLLGRAIFRTAHDAEVIFKGMVTIGLIYAPICLLEARISPQVHAWIYGYAPTGFAGVMRGSGFKPVGFQNSGLAVATFLFCCVACAAVLAKRNIRLYGMPAAGPMLLLWVVLGLSHNMAALLYSLAALPVIWLSRGKLAVTTGVALAFCVMLYPPIRVLEVVDVYELIEWIAQYSPDRAESLHVRFYNEDILYERAEERLRFGWGGFGRNRVYDDWGKDISLTDGEWIIRVGGRGVVGFVGIFGLILAPLFIARRAANRIQPGARLYIDALAIICAMFAVDLLPNSLFTKLPLFLGGALAGLSRGLARPSR